MEEVDAESCGHTQEEKAAKKHQQKSSSACDSPETQNENSLHDKDLNSNYSSESQRKY